MGFAEYKRDLLSADFDSNQLLDHYFHSRESHVFAQGGAGEASRLKREVAQALRMAFRIQIHPNQLVACGSAHLGFSPVPEKLGREFNPEDHDLDFAVISAELFCNWWSELQGAGLVADVRDKVSRDLFWGLIDPAKVCDLTVHGSRWLEAFSGIQTTEARSVSGRLYRSFWSMENIHRQAIVLGRAKLLQEREVCIGQKP